MKCQVIQLDDHRGMTELLGMRSGSDKLFYGFFDDNGDLHNCLSPNLSYADLLFIIDTLEQRKEEYYGH